MLKIMALVFIVQVHTFTCSGLMMLAHHFVMILIYNERVSEPGYRFDEWKLENNFNDTTNPKVFIESLKQDA